MKRFKRVVGFFLAAVLCLAGVNFSGWGQGSVKAENESYTFSVWDEEEQEGALSGKVTIVTSTKASDGTVTSIGRQLIEEGDNHYLWVIDDPAQIDVMKANGNLTVTATLDESYDRAFVTVDNATTLASSGTKTITKVYDDLSVLDASGDKGFLGDSYSVRKASIPSDKEYTFSAMYYNEEANKDIKVDGAKVTIERILGRWTDDGLDILKSYTLAEETDGSVTLTAEQIGFLGYVPLEDAELMVGYYVTIPNDLQDDYCFGWYMEDGEIVYNYSTEDDVWWVDDLDVLEDEEYNTNIYLQDKPKFLYANEALVAFETTDIIDGEEVHGYTAYCDAAGNELLNTKLQELAKNMKLGEYDYAAIDLHEQKLDINITKETMTALKTAGWTSIMAWMEDNDKHINYVGTSILKNQAFDPEIKVSTDEAALKMIKDSGYTGEVICAEVDGSFAGNIFLEFYSDGKDLFKVANYDLGDNYNPSSDGREVEAYGYYFNKSANEFQNWVGNGIYASAWITQDESDRLSDPEADLENDPVRYRYYLDLGDKPGTYAICNKPLDKSITGGKGEPAYYGEDYKLKQDELDKALLDDINAISNDTDFLAVTVPEGLELSQKVIKAAKDKGVTIYVKDLSGDAFYAFENLDTTDQMSGSFKLSVSAGDAVKAVDDALVKYTAEDGTVITDVSFKYDGVLPGKTKVTLDLSGQGYKNGDTVYLYYNDPEKGTLEQVSKGTYVDGLATFEMVHCSDYAVVNHELKVKTPNTGDETNVWMWLMMIVAGCGICLFERRKNIVK